MKIELSKSSMKFLESLDEKTSSKIKDKIKFLITSIENSGVLPYKSLDIKSLRGNWKPYKRLRIGKIRIIFFIDTTKNTLKIYDIDERGDIYK